jgi:WD40 repeat protein
MSGDGACILGGPPLGRLERADRSQRHDLVGHGGADRDPQPGRDEILTTVFSPDGRFLAVVQAPGIAQVWDLAKSPALFAAPIPARGVMFSPDSQELLSWDENDAQLWSLTSVGSQSTVSAPTP